MSKVLGACGELLRTMYGTLDAAACWEDDYSDLLLSAGYQKGQACPCVFWHPQLQVYCLVHGDDFVCVAWRSSLDYIEATLGMK